MNVVVPRGPGPWGGHGGMQWDDGVFYAIRELHLHFGDSFIHAIHILYETTDRKCVWSQRHGGTGGDKIYRVRKLNYLLADINLEIIKFVSVRN
jgi:hypothetical protein